MEEKIKVYLNSKLDKSNQKQNLEEFKNYTVFLNEFKLHKDIINLRVMDVMDIVLVQIPIENI